VTKKTATSPAVDSSAQPWLVGVLARDGADALRIPFEATVRSEFLS
jgi:hypothetical protein